MRVPSLGLFLSLSLLASVSVVALAPTAAAHTCEGYGNACGPCTIGEEHDHTNRDGGGYSRCQTYGDHGCDIHVHPVCIIIECLGAVATPLALAVPKLAAYEGALGACQA